MHHVFYGLSTIYWCMKVIFLVFIEDAYAATGYDSNLWYYAAIYLIYSVIRDVVYVSDIQYNIRNEVYQIINAIVVFYILFCMAPNVTKEEMQILLKDPRTFRLIVVMNLITIVFAMCIFINIFTVFYMLVLSCIKTTNYNGVDLYELANYHLPEKKENISKRNNSYIYDMFIKPDVLSNDKVIYKPIQFQI